MMFHEVSENNGQDGKSLFLTENNRASTHCFYHRHIKCKNKTKSCGCECHKLIEKNSKLDNGFTKEEVLSQLDIIHRNKEVWG